MRVVCFRVENFCGAGSGSLCYGFGDVGCLAGSCTLLAEPFGGCE